MNNYVDIFKNVHITGMKGTRFCATRFSFCHEVASREHQVMRKLKSE